TAGAPKAKAVALSFCRLLGLGCPKQAFAKIATPRNRKCAEFPLFIYLRGASTHRIGNFRVRTLTLRCFENKGKDLFRSSNINVGQRTDFSTLCD
ncbi:MAG: hypothetical protein ACXWUC_10630, partial [Methylosarcina sp.]